jgi:hypothetical protein
VAGLDPAIFVTSGQSDCALCEHFAGVQHLDRGYAIRRIEMQDDARVYLFPFNLWATDEADRQCVSLRIVRYLGNRDQRSRHHRDIRTRVAKHNP